MSQEIVLYDLPSREPCTSWSANVLKTRLVLNYKRIPHHTEWVPYVKLQETLAATGVQPHPPPTWAEYTAPTIRLPSGEVVMDSLRIAQKLEQLYPDPPLHLETEFHTKLAPIFVELFPALVAYFMPLVARNVIVPEDVEWFHADREKKLGMRLEDLEKVKGGEVAWQGAASGLKKLEELLKESKKGEEGPFLLGKEVCYGDFVLIAFVRMFEILGEESYEKLVGKVGGLRELYEAGRHWAVERH